MNCDSLYVLRVMIALGSLLLVLSAQGFAQTLKPELTPVLPRGVSCVDILRECLSQGKLPDRAQGCVYPLERGSCPEGQWLILDPLGASASQLVRCARRPCPTGQVLSEGRCISESDARRSLCAGDVVHLDPTGAPRCGHPPSWKNLLLKYVYCVDSTETVTFSNDETETTITTAIFVDGVECPLNDFNICGQEVTEFTPSIALEPET